MKLLLKTLQVSGKQKVHGVLNVASIQSISWNNYMVIKLSKNIWFNLLTNQDHCHKKYLKNLQNHFGKLLVFYRSALRQVLH